ncbi:MAG: ABC transporter substrate-binding protein [Peptococcaceae bacterium]|jgi:peptide/nickel transport system substrate-binding protein|nr:ABC transporter substrate-binding protein [Peptococcaceae bacterium]
MKKAIALLISLSLLFTIAGCGGSQPAPPAQQPDPPALIDHTQTNNQSSPGTTTPTPEPPPVQSGPKYGGVVKMITTADTSYPFGLSWNSALNFATQVIVPFGECLVLETTGGDIYPWLATEWEIDVENAEVRLKLRDDVYFSDGSKFNADVVEWNFIMSKEAKALNPAIDRVEKRGEYEVAAVMTGGNFANNVLNLLASHSFAIVSKESYDKYGVDYAGEHPVGTGPFVMTEKNPGVSVKFTKNGNYWQPEKPYLDGFEFYAITDQMTQNAAMLSTGSDRVDVLNNAGSAAEQMSLLDKDPDLTVWAFPSGVTSIFPSSKTEESPFSKLEVRQAVSYAINREDFAEAKGFGYLQPATQFIPDGYYGHFKDGRNLFEFNPDKAKELLAEAGYPDGFTTNWYAVNTMSPDMSVALTDMLSAVGIKCNMELPEVGRITELRSTGWEGLIYQPFTSLAALPSTFRLSLDIAGVYNVSTWRPPGYELDFAALLKTPTFDQGIAEKMHHWFSDYMLIVPVIESVNSYVVRNSIKDAEYGFWAVGTQWLPSNMWLDN